MKQMRESIQYKLISMASILLDDIIVPGEAVQRGQESIVASIYDKDGNKLTFDLSLTVTPKDIEEVEPVPTLSEQLSLLLEEITDLKIEVARLRSYHEQSIEQNEEEESD